MLLGRLPQSSVNISLLWKLMVVICEVFLVNACHSAVVNG